MDFIKFFIKKNCLDSDKINKISVICLLSMFNENICDLDSKLCKNEYDLKEVAQMVEVQLENNKINRHSFKAKLEATLDIKSTNELIELLFCQNDELNYIELNKRINKLCIK